tara:strand:- start:810 stop:1118 length:309 start_codon:yes stop_codon:yes gene_type:complete
VILYTIDHLPFSLPLVIPISKNIKSIYIVTTLNVLLTTSILISQMLLIISLSFLLACIDRYGDSLLPQPGAGGRSYLEMEFLNSKEEDMKVFNSCDEKELFF